MSGHPRVLGYLQRAVNHEFSAVQQFTLQAVLADSWRMPELADELRAAAREELMHAEAFMQQLTEMGATPGVGQLRAPPVGRSRMELLRHGLDTEINAVRLYREAERFCEGIGDTTRSALFARILSDELRHQADLDRQLQALGAG